MHAARCTKAGGIGQKRNEVVLIKCSDGQSYQLVILGDGVSAKPPSVQPLWSRGWEDDLVTYTN